MGLATMQGNLVLVANELRADDEEEGDGVVGKELLTETIPESTEFLSLDWYNSSGVNKTPLLRFVEEDDNIICMQSTLLDRGLGEGGIAPRGTNLIPKPDDVLFLPLPILPFPFLPLCLR